MRLTSVTASGKKIRRFWKIGLTIDIQKSGAYCRWIALTTICAPVLSRSGESKVIQAMSAPDNLAGGVSRPTIPDADYGIASAMAWPNHPEKGLVMTKGDRHDLLQHYTRIREYSDAI